MNFPSVNDVTSAVQTGAGQANDAAHDAGTAAANTAQDVAGKAHDAATQGGEAARDPKGAADHAQATGQHILDAGMGDARAVADQLRSAPAKVRDAVLHLAHQRYGNGFVQQVLDLVHHAGGVVDAKLAASKDAIRHKQNQLRGLGARLGAGGNAIAGVIERVAAVELENIREIAAAEAVHAAVTEMVEVAIVVLRPLAATPVLVGLIGRVADLVQELLAGALTIGVFALKSELQKVKQELQRLQAEGHRLDGRVGAVEAELGHARARESGEQDNAKRQQDANQRVRHSVDAGADKLADGRDAIVNLGS